MLTVLFKNTMKQFRFLFMTVFLLFAVTGLRASIPDLKENSKTKKLKDEVFSKMEKKDLKTTNQTNFLVVNNLFFESDIPIISVNKDYRLPTKSIQKFSKTIKEKNKTKLYRTARDGFICSHKS